MAAVRQCTEDTTSSSLLRSVPEGRCDYRLARSAWDGAPKEPQGRPCATFYASAEWREDKKCFGRV
jgi:hypothetical protein